MATASDDHFKTFKRHRHYTRILEHTTGPQGWEYLDYIKDKYPDLLPTFTKFKTNDDIGDPMCFEYAEYGSMSPTTLRYIKVLGDLQSIFGSLDGFQIVEIGGGYGGQCKIIHDRYDCGAYDILDIPDAHALACKYLKQHGISLQRVSTPDLVISNYAFSECTRDVQLKYLNDVILPSRRGYMTCNFVTTDSYPLEELLQIIPNSRTIEEEVASYPGNVIVLWG